MDVLGEHFSEADVAVVGMRCHFPGASDMNEFWDVLTHGRETISHFSAAELVGAGVPPNRVEDPNYVRAKGVIHGVELFDHEFFGFTELEATVMDPQQRLFLEFVWKALEEAGYDSEQFDGRIGLFAGQAFNTYLLNNLRHARESHVAKFHGIDLLVMTDKDFLTTLAAHHLGLRGPVMTVQTACSTSVVAIHQACQALLSRECEVAVAGAITVYSPQVKGYFYEPGNLISPDGHIRSFDAEGRGTVYSSGMGAVVLKLLDDALRDGDTVHAVVKGSAVNNDGGRKALFKAPSEDGIADVVATAIAVSGVDPDRIRMVEANGSGTRNGDPIEVHGLTRAYREYTPAVGRCAIGSVKSNVGHLNVAAGMAAVLKTALCLKHGQIAPTINYAEPNPDIRFEDSPFVVATELRDWPSDDGPRIAAVNSYGVGGTNGHIVMSQAPPTDPGSVTAGPQLLVLSAKTESALERMRVALVDHLRTDRGTDLADVCFTLQVGRRGLPFRIAVTGASHDEIADELDRAPVSGVGRVRAATWSFVPDTGQPGRTVSTAILDEVGDLLDDENTARLAGLLADLSVLGELAPVVGVAAATGRGTGALAASVARGERTAREAVTAALRGTPADDGPAERAADLEIRSGRIARADELDRADGPDVIAVPDALAALWRSGVQVTWTAWHDGERRLRVPLPTYSFEPSRNWVDIPVAPVAHVYDAAL